MRNYHHHIILLQSLLITTISCHDACEPQYVPASFNYKINEDHPIGRPIGKLLFHGDEPLVSYELISSTNPDGPESYFQITSKRLILTKRLDFEQWRSRQKRNPFILALKCTFNPTKRLTVHNISVELIDVNDNAPYLVNVPYFVNVLKETSPGSVVVPNIQAMDDDSDQNGNVTIRVDENSKYSQYFDVVMNSDDGHNRGNLIVKRPLDSLKEARIRLELKARDHGNHPLSSSASINIAIVDSHHMKRPTFSKMSYTVELNTYTPKDSIVIPTAGSIRAFLDSGSNAADTTMINYRIMDPSGSCPLTIDSRTGLLRYNGRYLPSRSNYLVKACTSSSLCEKVLLVVLRTNTTLDPGKSTTMQFEVVKPANEPVYPHLLDEFTFLTKLKTPKSKLDFSKSSISITCNNSDKSLLRVAEQGPRSPILLMKRHHSVPVDTCVHCRISIDQQLKEIHILYDILLNILRPITFEQSSYSFDLILTVGDNNTAAHSIIGQIRAISSPKPKLVYSIRSGSPALVVTHICVAETGILYWCQSPPRSFSPRTKSALAFNVTAAYSGIPDSLTSVSVNLTIPDDRALSLLNISANHDSELVYLFLGSLICVVALATVASSVFVCYSRQFMSTCNQGSGSTAELGSLDVYDDIVKFSSNANNNSGSQNESSAMVMPLLRSYSGTKSSYERSNSRASSNANNHYAGLNVVEETASTFIPSKSSRLSSTLSSSNRPQRCLRDSRSFEDIIEHQPMLPPPLPLRRNSSVATDRSLTMSKRQKFNYKHSGCFVVNMTSEESAAPATYLHASNTPFESPIERGKVEQDRSINHLTFAM